MSRNAYLLRTYGITEEEYDAILAAQYGRCAICARPVKRKHLAVDHSHVLGWVRGLLCDRCNFDLLGVIGENATLYHRAAHYLWTPPAFDVIGIRRVPDAPPAFPNSR